MLPRTIIGWLALVSGLALCICSSITKGIGPEWFLVLVVLALLVALDPLSEVSWVVTSRIMRKNGYRKEARIIEYSYTVAAILIFIAGQFVYGLDYDLTAQTISYKGWWGTWWAPLIFIGMCLVIKTSRKIETTLKDRVSQQRATTPDCGNELSHEGC